MYAWLLVGHHLLTRKSRLLPAWLSRKLADLSKIMGWPCRPGVTFLQEIGKFHSSCHHHRDMSSRPGGPQTERRPGQPSRTVSLCLWNVRQPRAAETDTRHYIGYNSAQIADIFPTRLLILPISISFLLKVTLEFLSTGLKTETKGKYWILIAYFLLS